MLLISIAQKAAEERNLSLLNTNEVGVAGALRGEQSPLRTGASWSEFQLTVRVEERHAQGRWMFMLGERVALTLCLLGPLLLCRAVAKLPPPHLESWRVHCSWGHSLVPWLPWH